MLHVFHFIEVHVSKEYKTSKDRDLVKEKKRWWLWGKKEERQCYSVDVLENTRVVVVHGLKCKHETTNSDWQNVNSNILCGVNFVSTFIVSVQVLKIKWRFIRKTQIFNTTIVH